MFSSESPLFVTAQFHAEMDSTPNVSPCSKAADQFPNRTPKRPPVRKINFEEMFAIEDDIPWKIVSKNLDFYKIKENPAITHHFSHPDVSDSADVSSKQTAMEIDCEKRNHRTSSSVKRIRDFLKNSNEMGPPRVVNLQKHSSRVDSERKKAKRKITYELDDFTEAKRMRKERYNENVAEMNELDENQENDDSSISSSVYGKQINQSQNMFRIRFNGEPIKRQIKSIPLSTSNRPDAFDMILSTPSYNRGQLHETSTFFNRNYSHSTPPQYFDRVPNTSDSSDTDQEGQ